MRLYERALPEMLRFRDSREIMYEVPLFPSPDPFPSKPASASADFLTGNPVLPRTIRQADEKARRERKRRRRREEGNNWTDKQSSENEPRKSAAADFPLYFSPFASSSALFTSPSSSFLILFFSLFIFFFLFLINIFFYHGDTTEKFYRIESVFERKIDNFKREK